MSNHAKNSTIHHTSTGVPQRSVLGPKLFLVSRNYIPERPDAELRLHADDTELTARD
jgi:hypothetical protein